MTTCYSTCETNVTPTLTSDEVDSDVENTDPQNFDILDHSSLKNTTDTIIKSTPISRKELLDIWKTKRSEEKNNKKCTKKRFRLPTKLISTPILNEYTKNNGSYKRMPLEPLPSTPCDNLSMSQYSQLTPTCATPSFRLLAITKKLAKWREGKTCYSLSESTPLSALKALPKRQRISMTPMEQKHHLSNSPSYTRTCLTFEDALKRASSLEEANFPSRAAEVLRNFLRNNPEEREKAEKSALYWLTRARLAEHAHLMNEAVSCYEQATAHRAQPFDSVRKSLRSFMHRLKADSEQSIKSSPLSPPRRVINNDANDEHILPPVTPLASFLSGYISNEKQSSPRPRQIVNNDNVGENEKLISRSLVGIEDENTPLSPQEPLLSSKLAEEFVGRSPEPYTPNKFKKLHTQKSTPKKATEAKHILPPSGSKAENTYISSLRDTCTSFSHYSPNTSNKSLLCKTPNPSPSKNKIKIPKSSPYIDNFKTSTDHLSESFRRISLGKPKRKVTKSPPPPPPDNGPAEIEISEAGGSFLSLEPIQASRKQKEHFGADLILSPVRRSYRTSPSPAHFRLTPNKKGLRDWQQKVMKTADVSYAYSPNPAIISSGKGLSITTTNIDNTLENNNSLHSEKNTENILSPVLETNNEQESPSKSNTHCISASTLFDEELRQMEQAQGDEPNDDDLVRDLSSSFAECADITEEDETQPIQLLQDQMEKDIEEISTSTSQTHTNKFYTRRKGSLIVCVHCGSTDRLKWGENDEICCGSCIDEID